MNWSQLIATFIFVIGIFISVTAALYIIHIWRQKLPEHTRVALEQFARQAVWQVEQTSATMSGATKKQMAISAVLKLFAAFGLPAPPMEAIDIAIEAAVFVLSHIVTIEASNPPKLEPPKQG